MDKELLTLLQSISVTPVSSVLHNNISEGAEVQSGDTLLHDCSSWWANVCLNSHLAILVYITLNICAAHMCELHIFSWWPSCRFLVYLQKICNCTISLASNTLTNLIMVNFPCIPCSGCEHGRWNCSLKHCPVHGGLSPWTSWSSCSLSCGGLGLKTRTRACSQPASAHGGRDCQGPRQETTFCQAPQCPGTGNLAKWSTVHKTITQG